LPYFVQFLFDAPEGANPG